MLHGGEYTRPRPPAMSRSTRDRPASSMSQRRTIVVVVEHHHILTPHGVFAPQGMGLPYAYWRQYLGLFDQVRPVGRARRLAGGERPDPAWQRVDGPGVCFVPIPEQQGLGQLLRALPRTWSALGQGLRGGDYFFLRGGGPMGTLAWLRLRARGVPYGRQVVGHDREALLGALAHLPGPVRRLVAEAGHWLARQQVRGAACAAYVSPALARSYPAAPGAPRFCFSDVTLGPDIMTGPRPASGFCAEPLRLVSVGRLSPEKGHRVLIEALAHLDRAGAGAFTLELIGPGPEQEALRALARERGLADRVTLSGLVPWGPALFERLDAADLFVLPSLTEGLPRALLEAMSRGLPAIATRVGGVPDVLDEMPDAAPGAPLVPPGDPVALAARIRDYMAQPTRLAAASQRSFERAMRWHPDVMDAVKQDFWRTLRHYTDAWRSRR